jgi:hypothetical protein
MTDPSDRHDDHVPESSGNGLPQSPRRARDRPIPAAPPAHFAIQRWVNEGGSLAPPGDEAAPPAESSGKEARDTVAGCRDRAAGDHLLAASADTENSRIIFERSAASWEKRADEIGEREQNEASQRAADRELWASEERDHPDLPD